MGWFTRCALPVLAVATLLAACGLDAVGTNAGGASSSSGSSGGDTGRDASGEATAPDPRLPDGAVPVDAGVDADAALPSPGTSSVSIAVTSLGNAAQTIDLTSEGTLDWIYWAYNGNVASDVRKATTTPLIGSPYAYGGNNVVRGANTQLWPLVQTWTDGNVPQAGSSTWYTYFNSSNDVAITMTAAAATTPRTFTFYAAAGDVVANVEAKLPDGTTSSSTQDTKDDPRYMRIAITYQSATAGGQLEVRWRVTQRYNASPNAAIIISSATLK